MNKENLERGKKIQYELDTIEYNLDMWNNKEKNPSAKELCWYGSHISEKAGEEIREIAIRSLNNKKSSLQHEFNNL